MKREILFWFAIGAFAVLLTVGSCGKEDAVKPPPVTERKPTTLFIFSAKFCETCKHKLPELQKLIAGLSVEANDHLLESLWLTAGDPASELPTYPMAEAYFKTYYPSQSGVPFADERWRQYKNLNHGYPLEVPMAVVTDSNGTVLKRFTAGQFHPQEILQRVKERVGE